MRSENVVRGHQVPDHWRAWLLDELMYQLGCEIIEIRSDGMAQEKPFTSFSYQARKKDGPTTVCMVPGPEDGLVPTTP